MEKHSPPPREAAGYSSLVTVVVIVHCIQCTDGDVVEEDTGEGVGSLRTEIITFISHTFVFVIKALSIAIQVKSNIHMWDKNTLHSKLIKQKFFLLHLIQ